MPAAYFLGAVGAGAAAWAAAAPIRHGLGEQLAAARAHPAVIEAYRLAATAVVLLVPYVVGCAVGFGLTARTFPPGVHLWLGYVTLGVFAILLATCWGWALGKLFGSVYAALAAVLSWFLFLSAFDNSVGFAVVSGPPEVTVDPMVMGLRLGTVALLLVTLVWMSPLSWLRERPTRALAPAAAGGVLAVVLAMTTPVVDREPPGEVICVQGRMELCIWPEHEKYLPLLADVSARIDALPDAFYLPPRMNEYGVERVNYVDEEGVIRENPGTLPYFLILEGSPWSLAGEITTAIMYETWRSCDEHPSDAPAASQRQRSNALYGWLEAYLAGAGEPDYATNAPSEFQRGWAAGREIANTLPVAEQLTWAEQEVREIRDHCQRDDAAA